MMNSRFVFVQILLCLVLVSCGNPQGSGEASLIPRYSIGGSEYGVLRGREELEISSNQVKGTGQILFANPLGEIGSGSGFDLVFGLEDGGSLTLIAYADKALKNGFRVRFERQRSVLSGKIFAGPNGSGVPMGNGLIGFDASSAIKVAIDIHNDEKPAHFLLWAGDEYLMDLAVVNSAKDPRFKSPGNGSGTFYGLELSGATVTTIKAGNAKVEDHD